MKSNATPSVKRGGSVFKGENGKILLVFILFVIGIAVVELIMTATSTGAVAYPKYIAASNWFNILMQVSVVGVAAMGMAVVMIGGGIDLSIGMLVSFVVLFVAKSYTDWGWPFALSLIMVIVFAILLETGMGLIISRFNVEPFIITLGGMISIRGIALVICNQKEVRIDGGVVDWLKVNMIPEGLKDPVTNLPLVLQFYVILFVIAAVAIFLIMKYTKYGRRVYAVGANRQAAFLAGINVKGIVMSTYSLNGLLVAIAGIVSLARNSTAIITVGQNLEIDVITAVVIGGVAMAGGRGNIIGVIIGVFLMGAIGNGMNILRIQADWQFVVKGAILILVVSLGAIAASMQQKNLLKQQKEEYEAQKAAEAAK